MLKIVKNCQKKCQNLVRSCFLITPIKCLKGHKSLGSLCNVKSKSPQWVSQSVTRSPIELLWTAKNYFQYKLVTFSFFIWTQGDTLLLVHSEWSFGRNRIAYFVCETWKINNVKCIWLFITKIEKTSVLLLVAMNSQAHWARANTFYMIHNSNINTAFDFTKYFHALKQTLAFKDCTFGESKYSFCSS